jgi:hypothetical protein
MDRASKKKQKAEKADLLALRLPKPKPKTQSGVSKRAAACVRRTVLALLDLGSPHGGCLGASISAPVMRS